jgi:hypothetical protein
MFQIAYRRVLIANEDGLHHPLAFIVLGTRGLTPRPQR